MKALIFALIAGVVIWLIAIHEGSKPRYVTPFTDNPDVDPATYKLPKSELPILQRMVKRNAPVEIGDGAVPYTPTAPGDYSGILERGPLYENMVPAHLQNTRARDGIPYDGFIPTARIDNPNNPYLRLNPITAFTFYLRAIPPKRPRATPRTLVKYPRYPRQMGVTN